MWGQDGGVFSPESYGGIIPTRVGTSDTCALCVKKFQDHPHACGDKKYLRAQRLSLQGSSPRVWGQEYGLRSAGAKKRIIPTRVGTSTGLVNQVDTSEDHPHACGDKYLLLLAHEGIVGSSPRVWGQVLIYA